MRDRTEQALLRRLNGRQPPAFILGTSSPHALGFVRTFGRRGIPVVVVSADAGRVWSRYTLMQRMIKGEEELVAFLESVGSRMSDKGVMFPTGDADVLFMSKYRDRLAAHFDFVLPDAPVLDLLANKKTQYECASRIGIPTPRTYTPAGQADLQHVAATIGYPCVIKPAYPHIWRRYQRQTGTMRQWAKAAHVETPQQLQTVYEQMAKGGSELLVQERIEGPDSRLYLCYMYFDRHSEPLATCVIRKQRQWPPRYGTGSYLVSCHQPVVVEQSLKLLKHIGYRGLADLEFKHDHKDGRLKLIEVNVRCGDPVALALAAGVDIPFIAYKDARGISTAHANAYDIDVTWVNAVDDFRAFWHYRKVEPLSGWRWLRSVLGARSHAYFAWDDPVPPLVHLGHRAIKAATYLPRRLKSGLRGSDPA